MGVDPMEEPEPAWGSEMVGGMIWEMWKIGCVVAGTPAYRYP